MKTLTDGADHSADSTAMTALPSGPAHTRSGKGRVRMDTCIDTCIYIGIYIGMYVKTYLCILGNVLSLDYSLTSLGLALGHKACAQDAPRHKDAPRDFF